MAWGWYQKEAHLNVVQMYIDEERFAAYYDQYGDGLAQLLRDLVHKYV